MPPSPPIPGSNELATPAYFVTDEHAPELARWKQEHPDWFVAGTRTPPSRSAGQSNAGTPPAAGPSADGNPQTPRTNHIRD